MGLRFLVVEGNTREARDRHAVEFGLTPSQSYAAVLERITPGAVCDLAFPADEGANLPDPAGVASYDGVALTGSALHVYQLEPAVSRQIELMRAVYTSGVPAFGSCWGLVSGFGARSLPWPARPWSFPLYIRSFSKVLSPNDRPTSRLVPS